MNLKLFSVSFEVLRKVRKVCTVHICEVFRWTCGVLLLCFARIV